MSVPQPSHLSIMTELSGSGSRWLVYQGAGLDGMELQPDPGIALEPLADHVCLVAINAVSLNYRDIAIPMGKYPGYLLPSYVPCSDAACTVIATGSRVKQFKKGDRLCPTFFQDVKAAVGSSERRDSSLGGKTDGVLRTYAIFPESSLVAAPSTLTLAEASTLPCAGLTAWNALFGLEGRQLGPGQCVLTQGTGGVSLFAILFALAIGATVIATTSTDEKAEKLRSMGVQHVINYKTDSTWGETAKKLSAGGLGVNHILEVGGNNTMPQSFAAIRPEGVISIIGFLGGTEQSSSNFWDTMATLSIVRGVNVGTKEQFEEMNSFIEQHRIKPVLDEQSFSYTESEAAFQYLSGQKLFGKVVINVTQ